MTDKTNHNRIWEKGMLNPNRDHYNIGDAYKSYRHSTEKKYSLHQREFIKLVNDFSKMMAELVIDGHTVHLPCGMGTLSVIGRKQDIRMIDGRIYGLPPDWRKTMEYRKKYGGDKIIYFTNEHTGGYRYKYLWSKKKMWVQYKLMYCFIPSRTNKRTLAKEIKNGKEYLIIH